MFLNLQKICLNGITLLLKFHCNIFIYYNLYSIILILKYNLHYEKYKVMDFTSVFIIIYCKKYLRVNIYLQFGQTVIYICV